jgi:glycosyltransferase involved in cell wall biosynthesis
MRPRRILMTADAVGGVWSYVLELAKDLCAHGTEILLVVIGPEPTPDQREEAIRIPGLALVVPHLELEWQDRAGPLTAEARQRLSSLADAFRPDLVHCNGFREAAAGFRVPVLVVAHSCVRTWWKACRQEAAPAEWEAYARGVQAGLAAAAAVAAPTEAFLADFAAAWGPLTHPRIVPNGFDLEPVTALRRRPVILAAGRLWDEAKNVQALAGIAPSLPWPVLLAGDALEEEARSGVRWLGRLSRPELHALMVEAAIFVAPARYEPFGLAALEAGRSGCALVLGKIPTLVEIWDGAARFVSPGDPMALRRTLLDLIDDQEALCRLQVAAAQRAALYSRRRMVEGYEALYVEILDHHPTAEDRAA